MMPRAKKSFGQNWLVDASVVAKIVAAADIQTGEAVLEIGPGTGLLTRALVDAGANLTAIEADASLIPALSEQFGDTITLIQGDALQEAIVFEPFGYKLIANIPYYITSEIIRRFLTEVARPSRMVLMVQKEVADRMTALPGDLSLLGVVCQLYATCTRVTKVPAGAFVPIPKVDSAVVQLDVLDADNVWGIDPETVIGVAKRGFAQRRKQLKKNLSSHPEWNVEMLLSAFEEVGLAPTVRAQEVSIPQWVKLTHILLRTS